MRPGRRDLPMERVSRQGANQLDAFRAQVLERRTLAADLELALHRILSRTGFSGPGHIHVSMADEAIEPRYVVVIDSDAAWIIAQFFRSPSHLGINDNPVVWTIEPKKAKAIVSAAR
jgi:hypothetical protein